VGATHAAVAGLGFVGVTRSTWSGVLVYSLAGRQGFESSRSLGRSRCQTRFKLEKGRKPAVVLWRSGIRFVGAVARVASKMSGSFSLG